MRITNELEKRVDKAVLAFACDECNGYGVVGQSPYNPQGDICQPCDGDGWSGDGNIFNDVLQSVKRTLNEYISEFGGESKALKEVK